MAFVIKAVDTFEWKVDYNYPDGGKHVKGKFDAVFEILNEDENREFFGEGSNRPTSEFVLRVLKSFSGIDVADESGKILPVEDAIPVLAKHPIIAPALVRAYFGGLSGAKTKN